MPDSAAQKVEYLPDSGVTEAIDRELRGLFTTCFTKPQDVVFRDRRYFVHPYPHRWIIRDSRGVIIAHIGVHEKTVESEGRTFRIGGICEVSVHPDHRRRGYVRLMLASIHEWLAQRGFVFSVLFGDPKFYSSSGYVQVKNLYHDEGPGTKREQATGMVKELSNARWPAADVYFFGPKF